MDRHPVISADGSHTLYVPALGEHYHSVHGAVREAEHVFIRECFLYSGLKKAVIFEAGFGTGLNALLTLQAAITHGVTVEYHSIEKYPLSEDRMEVPESRTIVG